MYQLRQLSWLGLNLEHVRTHIFQSLVKLVHLCHDVVVSDCLGEVAMETFHKGVQRAEYNESDFVSEGSLHLDVECHLLR